MPVTSTDHVCVRAEKAFAAYIRADRDTNADDATFTGAIDFDCDRAGVLNGIPVYEGRNTSQVSTPAIVVSCDKSRLMADGTAWYEVTVQIMLLTHRHEDDSSVARADVTHNSRFAALEDLVCDEDTIKAALNEGDPDTRDVDEFTVMGCFLDNSFGEFANDHIADTIELSVYCAPWDAA